MLLSLLETILVMHLLERDNAPQTVPSGDQALSDENEANSIFPNFQGGETRNLEKPEFRDQDKAPLYAPVGSTPRVLQAGGWLSVGGLGSLLFGFLFDFSPGVTSWSQRMPDASMGDTLSELLPVEVRKELRKT